MDYKAIWNDICFHVSKNRGNAERDFQTTVEFIFEKIGWSQYKGEIVTQLNIPVGSSGSVRPDLVIKENDDLVLVVELKRADADLSERNADQLVSYMRLLRLNYGILLGETLQIYSEVQLKNNSPVRICDISFIEDAEIVVECIKVLSKHEFTFDRLDEFTSKCLAHPDKYNDTKKPKSTYAPASSKPKKDYEKGGKSRYPTSKTIEGFEEKYRPKQLLPKIPDEFIQTNELREIIWWNDFSATA